jgi:hypothetical protein
MMMNIYIYVYIYIYISAIHKKGKNDEYENYRGITVLNIFSRLYGKIIKYFLEQEFSQIETEEQAGFRGGRSTIDHVFSLKQLMEKKMSVDQTLHLLFVDLEKAYDSVPLKKLWKALEHYNISKSIIRAIKRLYEISSSKIKIGKQLCSGFYVTKGLRQGCSLSPTLFKIYNQKALENWQKNVQGWDWRYSIRQYVGIGDSGYNNILGLEIQDTTIYSMLFAGEQLLIEQDYEDLEYIQGN